MSYPQYLPVQPYSPLNVSGGGNTNAYTSPESYAQPFPTYNSSHGDLGALGIEMQGTTRPPAPHRQSGNSIHSFQSMQSMQSSPGPPIAHRDTGQSMYSNASTLFPPQGTPGTESESFLHDPLNRLDTSYTLHHVPYKDNTGRQLRHILIGSSFRWFITAGLCAAYIMVTRTWNQKGALSESQKRIYNAITTAISIALGLNIASAFKDLALTMRWPILHAKKRNLVELDLLLHADSLTQLARLALVSRSPKVFISCFLWLFINILAQGGIAMLNLTYGFEVNVGSILQNPGGNVSIANMQHFWPQGDNSEVTPAGEEYTAHVFGGLAYNYGSNTTEFMPKAGDVSRAEDSMLWYNQTSLTMEFRFSEAGPYIEGALSQPAFYTNRKIITSYQCESHEVTAGGNGTSNTIEVANVGKVHISHTLPDSVVFFTETKNQCGNDPRCSIVQVFEASADKAWYYKCTVKLGETENDPTKLSYISNEMAHIATSSIARTGYSDDPNQQVQIYPNNTYWGYPVQGNADLMAWQIATFALGSVAGASLFNIKTYYTGTAPSQGFALTIGHPKFFYLIIGLICGCQLIFCVIVAVLANQVMVGPDAHLSMSLLLRPIADSLEGVSNGKVNSAYKNAKKQTMVKYEKASNGRWVLNMS